MADKLDKAFTWQREFMDMLVEYDRLPEYPVDLTTKQGQRLIKEYVWNSVAELAEASQTLRNKNHVIREEPEIDFDHYLEELGDAFAFFMEICILSNISAEQLYNQFQKKNQIVRQKLLASIETEEQE